LSKHHSKFEPTGLERLADMIIELHRSPHFPMTLSFEVVTWRGKPTVRMSLFNAIAGPAAIKKRGQLQFIKRLTRVVQAKLIKERVQSLRAELKAKGMSADDAEREALKKIGGMFGLGPTTVKSYVNGKAFVEKRKPKDLRTHARRKRRAKITP
jgi:hypothetical protein